MSSAHQRSVSLVGGGAAVPGLLSFAVWGSGVGLPVVIPTTG